MQKFTKKFTAPQIREIGELLARATQLRQNNQLAQAHILCELILDMHPQHPDANLLLAAMALQDGRCAQADACARIALAHNDKNASAHLILASALHSLKRPLDALLHFERATTIDPRLVVAHCNMGQTLTDLQQHERAVACFDKAIALQPTLVVAHFNRAVALATMQRYEAAIAGYNQTISLAPRHFEAYSNRGIAQMGLNQMEASVASFEAAIAIHPHFVPAYSNRGNAQQALLQLDAALQSYEQALALQPDYANVHLNKAMVLLLKGNFAQGWETFEWRWKTIRRKPNLPTLERPHWNGVDSLDGKTILLYAEQGLGDTLQFCRYAALLRQRAAGGGGARIILEVQSALKGLLYALEGVDALVEAGSALPAHEYCYPLMSLPMLFKTDASNVPSPQGYLRADTVRVAQWAQRLGPQTKPRIGVVWSGNPEQGNDRNRSTTLAQFGQFFHGGFEYISLQKELRGTDASTLEAIPFIRHFGDELTDFSDTAALCSLVDVVVSVCTSVAHLAGALGRPTWVTLCYCPDWRWMLGTNKSPWYTSARLYRQSAPNDWASVMRQVQHDLEHVEKGARLDESAERFPDRLGR